MKKIFLTMIAVAACSVTALAQCVYPTDNVTINFKRKIPGLLDGNFTINPSGDKVAFSKGNLQYTRESTSTPWEDGKFSFMAHQWDYIETTANPYCTDDYGDKTAIGLFGWGTAGNSEATGAYQPYATSTTNTEYVKYRTAAGEWTASNSDWGVVNSGDLGAGWRTLTKDEWDYLFNSRTGSKASVVGSTNDVRYAKATVNGKCGVILFPDGGTFATSEFSAVNSLNTATAAYTSTTCTSSQWDALELKGCVFLPAAGNRYGTSVSNVGSNGNYWSSSAYSAANAYFLLFYSGNVTPQNNYYRHSGYSVRLVQDVPAE